VAEVVQGERNQEGRTVLVLQSVQWMVFLLANVIATPIVVGAAFDLSPAEVSTFVQRMLFITGLATLAQVWFGHRLPMIEGSAGMWWALFVIMAALTAPGEKGLLLQQLEMGLLLSGVLLLLISFLPFVLRIRELFTPIVTGVFLVLLCVQLSGSFFKGMFGVTLSGAFDWRVAAVAFLVIAVVLTVSLKGRGLLKSMGPLLGILAGWGVFEWWQLGEAPMLQAEGSKWFAWPELFAFGAPVWDFGVVLTSLLTAVILISNLVASILVVAKSVDQEVTPKTFQRGLLGNGVSGLLAGAFSGVGLVPLSVSAGFILTTGIREKLPFVIGAMLVMLSGFVPFVGEFFARLPAEVAYAALFIPFSQMLGFGVRDLMGVQPTQRNLLVIGMSLMIGAGTMFVPPGAYAELAPWLRNLLANGLLMGLLACLLFEHVLFREKDEMQTSA
jgi:xanthine/uracil permease